MAGGAIDIRRLGRVGTPSTIVLFVTPPPRCRSERGSLASGRR